MPYHQPNGSRQRFSYDPQLDAFICPEGVPLTYHRLNCSKSTGKYLRCYQVEGDACMRCPKRPSCFDKAGIRRRVLASSCYPAFFKGHQRVGTPEFLSMMRLRKIWAEGSFSVLKREHCISKIRKRGILAATEECLLAAMALNLKRMAKCHLSLSPNLLFCWGHDGFQQNFYFCQQVQILTGPTLPQAFGQCQEILTLRTGGNLLLRYGQLAVKVDKCLLALILLHADHYHVAGAVAGDINGLTSLAAEVRDIIGIAAKIKEKKLPFDSGSSFHYSPSLVDTVGESITHPYKESN